VQTTDMPVVVTHRRVTVYALERAATIKCLV
jgi:hypothetical protein